MPETDALSNFDFSKVTKQGLFVKFESGKALTLRVLTVDPLVSNVEYEDKKTGEVNIQTKFAFVVYNFTDEKGQILQASPNMAKKIGELHVDPDFGANIRKIDIKITPSGEKLERRYDIQVLPKARDLTMEQVKECQAITLEDKVPDGQRMSIYEPDNKPEMKHSDEAPKDIVIEDLGEPISLDNFSF